MPRQKTLREKIEQRIARKTGDDVFLPREFYKLGGEDQVLRALRGLVRDGRLVRLGYGVYARAIVSRLSGEPLLYARNGLSGAARQALDKLGVAARRAEQKRLLVRRDAGGGDVGVQRLGQRVMAGRLVLARETRECGWWEAVVVERHRDLLTLRYRDYPDHPNFVRRPSAVALIAAPEF